MTDKRGRVITAASDGACSGNPGPGGWGALIRFEDGSVEEFGGHEPSTTNNRMELKAALVVLREIKDLQRQPGLKIRTDSKYLINGLSQWIFNWKRKNWKTASGKDVLNQDLWQELDKAQLTDVNLEYVKGHSGDKDNDRVDQIAVSFSKGLFIELEATKKNASSQLKLLSANDTDVMVKIHNHVSPKLHQLITRLELVDRLAKGGYGITTNELSEVINEPITNLQKEGRSRRWRDWLIESIGHNRWRFRLPAEESKLGKEGLEN